VVEWLFEWRFEWLFGNIKEIVEVVIVIESIKTMMLMLIEVAIRNSI
jgi:hypothetical protein